MADTQTGKRVAGWKRLLGWFLMLVWILIIIWLNRSCGPDIPAEASEEGVGMDHVVVAFAAGVFLLGAGIAGYFAVLGTNCFTFDFTRPFFRAYKAKLYIANILVPVLLILGIGFLVSMVMSPLLGVLGMSGGMALLTPIFLCLVVLQLFLVWFNLWAPLGKSTIRKRLAALGVLPETIALGFPVAISNPDKSSFKKFGSVADDVGMLWIQPDRLRYMGDTDQFEVKRQHLVQVERKGDPGSTASVFGGVKHVILHIREEANERRIRLHPGGNWTLSSSARASDRLAELIEEWHRSSENQPPPLPGTLSPG